MLKKAINCIYTYLIKHMRAIEFWFLDWFVDPNVRPYTFSEGKRPSEPDAYTNPNKVRSKKNK